MKRSIVALGAVAFLAACGGLGGGSTDGGTGGGSGTGGSGGTGGGAGTGGSSGSTTLDQACTSMASAACGKIIECAPYIADLAFGDAAACQASFKKDCVSGAALSGAATPSMAARDACTATYTALTCESLFASTAPAACNFPGTLVAGAACQSSAQCTSGLCKITSGSCGTCGTKVAAGATCQTGDTCVDGYTCAGSPKTCVAYVAKGGACSASAPCQGGLACVAAVCSLPASTAGAACDPLVSGACNFYKGLTCNATSKTCVLSALAAAGEACGVVGSSYTMCKHGLYCANTSTCAAQVAVGGACTSTAQCADSAACTNSVCTAPAPVTCP